MKNPNPHDGYAPDLFSEHARAAQLGLRVREILAKRNPYAPASLAERAIEDAARELGLLDKHKPHECALGRDCIKWRVPDAECESEGSADA